MSEHKSNLQAAKAFVDYGLMEKSKGHRESASGPGSSLTAAAAASKFLLRKFRELPIRSVLDLGCGDWNWMQHLGFPQPVPGRGITYEGWESSQELVDALRAKHGQDGVNFHVRDVSAEAFPDVDLIIARDILFHMPPDMGLDVVERIKKSGKYLAAPSYMFASTNSGFSEYLDIEGWGFFPINMNIEPFNLGPFFQECVIEPDCQYAGENRYFCFYGLAPIVAEPALEDPHPQLSRSSAIVATPEIITKIPAVSVIVTAYNDAESIQKAVTSITQQNIPDVEVIVLDDRSTDKTWLKVENLARWDDRIIPTRSSYNLGPSAMRNIGINNSHGEYVCFVDGDDTLCSGGLGQLLERAWSVSADVVRGSHVMKMNNQSSLNAPEHYHQPEVLRTCYADMPSLVQLYTSWNMLIRRHLIGKGGAQFNVNMRLGEDRVFNQQVFNAASSIALMKFESYNWVRNSGRKTHLSSGKKVADRLMSISAFLDTVATLENATPVHLKMVHASMAFELANCVRKSEREGTCFSDEIDSLWNRIQLDRRWITNPSIKGYEKPLLDDIILDKL
ncbi:SAM-dependent methyltransferase [Roseovarius sp. MBR-51]